MLFSFVYFHRCCYCLVIFSNATDLGAAFMVIMLLGSADPIVVSCCFPFLGVFIWVLQAVFGCVCKFLCHLASFWIVYGPFVLVGFEPVDLCFTGFIFCFLGFLFCVDPRI